MLIDARKDHRPLWALWLSIAASLAGCSAEFNWGSQFKSAPLITTPEVSVTLIDGTSVKIAWEAATMLDRATGQLEYKVVYTTGNPDQLQTVESANALTKPNLLVDWTPDLIEYVFTDVEPELTYYVTVLVRDPDDNISIYDVATFRVPGEGEGDLVLAGDYLKSPIKLGGLKFGNAVAQDGNYLAVCAHSDSAIFEGIAHGYDLEQYYVGNGTIPHNGALHIFRSMGDQWLHEGWIKPEKANTQQFFCSSVAVSGDTIVVGVVGDSYGYQSVINGDDLSARETGASAYRSGSAYVYRRVDGKWTLEAYLKAPNARANHYFGSAVAIENDLIAVSAPEEGSSTNTIIHGSDLSSTNTDYVKSGAVYIFRRTNSTWVHEAYLKAPNVDTASLFGRSIALSGNTLVVGAPGEKSQTTSIIHGNDLSATNQALFEAGAAYVFTITGTTWTHEAYLKPANVDKAASFGASVAISGDLIAVGAPQDTYPGNGIITGPDFSDIDQTSGEVYGAVWTYKRSHGLWARESYLKAPNNPKDSGFAYSLNMSESLITIGAYHEQSTTTQHIRGSDLTATNKDGTGIGAVYVYRRASANWTFSDYLKPFAGTHDDMLFGSAISVQGTRVVVGVSNEGSGLSYGEPYDQWSGGVGINGAAYVFRLDK